MSSVRPYRLAQRTYVCANGQGAVFLDLRRDVYLGVDAAQSAVLAALVEGWPIEAGRSAMATQEGRELAEALSGRDLLRERDLPREGDLPQEGDLPREGDSLSDRRPASPSSGCDVLPPVMDELVAWHHMPRVRIRFHHAFRFLRAWIVALWMLRCRSLFATVQRRERQRRGTCNSVLARELVGIYTLLRMFAFARRGRCLLDSVVMVEFLAAYGVRANWVIGVHVRPFSAHSWVQQEQWVLNGTPGFVRHFQPILVT